jgi:RNA polymerase sigma-70 factor, ECF subfamily
MVESTAQQPTDEALAVAVQQSDAGAFDELMRRYEERLIRYGKRFLARGEDIEDAVQDVFLKAYVNIQSYDPSYRFSPWIYRIAHNTFANVLREHSRRSFAFFDFDTLISPLTFSSEEETERTRSELKTLLESELQNLPPKYREVLVLHYFEELSYDEIAEVLHIPKGTVGVRLKRGREALKMRSDALKNHYHDT